MIHNFVPVMHNCCLHRNIAFCISQDAKFIFKNWHFTQRTGWNLLSSQILGHTKLIVQLGTNKWPVFFFFFFFFFVCLLLLLHCSSSYIPVQWLEILLSMLKMILDLENLKWWQVYICASIQLSSLAPRPTA